MAGGPETMLQKSAEVICVGKVIEIIENDRGIVHVIRPVAKLPKNCHHTVSSIQNQRENCSIFLLFRAPNRLQ